MNISMRVLTIMNLCMTEDKVEKRTEVNHAVVAAETKIMEEKSGNKIIFRRKKVTTCYFNKNFLLPPYRMSAVVGSNVNSF